MQIPLNRYTGVLTVVLAAQAVLYYSVAYRSEQTPVVSPLDTFPRLVGDWRAVSDVPLEKDVLELMKADDTLNRFYLQPARNMAVNLFIAFFKTQRYGQSPHSPKNCLPGNGYDTIENSSETFTVPVWNHPIQTNKFIVQHGNDKSVVLYWYQSHSRAIASEYAAKVWLVLDAIRYHRSDTSIVRVVVPVRDNDHGAATRIGIEFIQTMFPALLKQLPS
jgi:EpsI family protein